MQDLGLTGGDPQLTHKGTAHGRNTQEKSPGLIAEITFTQEVVTAPALPTNPNCDSI